MAAEYLQGRDHISTTKIQYFHHALRQTLGYDLHPSVTIEGSSVCQIADLGTQTAIWPVSVAESLRSHAEVHGFDLSDNFFPPKAWLPDNVKLHVQDVHQPFSPAFVGKFDVVHIRLFLALSAARVGEMVQSALILLKPGGHIQWVEHDKPRLRRVSASSGLTTVATDAFCSLQQQQRPWPDYDPGWVRRIAPAMTAAGLEVVAEESTLVRNSLLPQLSDLHILSLLDVPQGLSATIDAFKTEYLDSLAAEFKSGVAVADAFICVVGRKSQQPETERLATLV